MQFDTKNDPKLVLFIDMDDTSVYSSDKIQWSVPIHLLFSVKYVVLSHFIQTASTDSEQFLDLEHLWSSPKW